MTSATFEVEGEPRAPSTGGNPGDRARGILLPALGSCAVVVLMLASGSISRVPVFAGSVTFLAIAMAWDLRTRRIPNLLTLTSLAAVLLFQFGTGPDAGVRALAGIGVAFGLLILPYAIGALGAGDVKALMVLAAFWGPGIFLRVLPCMVVVGGMVGLLHLAWKGELAEMLFRWWLSLQRSASERSLVFIPSPPGSEARKGIPFALCAALGAVMFQLIQGRVA